MIDLLSKLGRREEIVTIGVVVRDPVTYQRYHIGVIAVTGDVDLLDQATANACVLFEAAIGRRIGCEQVETIVTLAKDADAEAMAAVRRWGREQERRGVLPLSLARLRSDPEIQVVR